MATRSRGFEERAPQAFVSDLKCTEAGVWAYCEAPSCGGAAPIDLTRWLRAGGRISNLTSLETRMRCICGARRAHLSTTRPDATSRRVTIYPFS
jgi:hypothetical protein